MTATEAQPPISPDLPEPAERDNRAPEVEVAKNRPTVVIRESL
jgi:hypothetical protein